MRKLPHTAAESILEFIMRRYERAYIVLTFNRPVERLGKAARWPRRRPGVARPPPPPPPLARAQMLATQLTHQGPHNLANTRHREVKLNSRLGTPKMAGFIPSTEGSWKFLGEPPPLYSVRATTRRHWRTRLGNTPHSGNRYSGGRSGTESSAEPNKGQCVSTTKCFEERACRSFSDST